MIAVHEELFNEHRDHCIRVYGLAKYLRYLHTDRDRTFTRPYLHTEGGLPGPLPDLIVNIPKYKNDARPNAIAKLMTNLTKVTLAANALLVGTKVAFLTNLTNVDGIGAL